MNTLVETTRKLGREHANPTSLRTRTLRAGTQRLAGWWMSDATSTSFAEAREHDRRLLQRVGPR